MSNIFEKLIDKIKRFFKKLFGKDEKKSSGSSSGTPTTSTPKPKPTPKPVDQDPYALVPSGQDSHGNTIYDPKKSNPNGKIDSILWKPKADHNPNAVVVVGCEDVRKEDLKLEILGKSGKPLKVNIPMTGRANGNRIHYRPDRTAKDFKKSAPIQLRFYQMVDGKKVIVQFKGKNVLTVTDPTRRKDV